MTYFNNDTVAKVDLTGLFNHTPHPGTQWEVVSGTAFFNAGFSINKIQGTGVTVYAPITPGVKKKVRIKATCGFESKEVDIIFCPPAPPGTIELEFSPSNTVCVTKTITVKAYEKLSGGGRAPASVNWTGNFEGKAEIVGAIGNPGKLTSKHEITILGIERASGLVLETEFPKTNAKTNALFNVSDTGWLEGDDTICAGEVKTFKAIVCKTKKYKVRVFESTGGITVDNAREFSFSINEPDEKEFEVKGFKAGKYTILLYHDGVIIDRKSVVVVDEGVILGRVPLCRGEVGFFSAHVCRDSKYKIVFTDGLSSGGAKEIGPFDGATTKKFNFNASGQTSGSIELYRDISGDDGGSEPGDPGNSPETPDNTNNGDTSPGEEDDEEDPGANWKLVYTLVVPVSNIHLIKSQEVCLEREAGAQTKILGFCVEYCDATMPPPKLWIDGDSVEGHRINIGDEIPWGTITPEGKQIYAFKLKAVKPGESEVYVTAGDEKSNVAKVKVENVKYISWNKTLNKEWKDITHYSIPKRNNPSKTVVIQLRDPDEDEGAHGGHESGGTEENSSSEAEITWKVEAYLLVNGDCGSSSTVPFELAEGSYEVLDGGKELSLTYYTDPGLYYYATAIFDCMGKQYEKVHRISILNSMGEIGSKDVVPFAPSSKYRNLTIHGQPATTVKPQQDKEKDQPDNKFSIDAYNLSATYSTTDISIPLRGSDLRLEFRRTSSPDTIPMAMPCAEPPEQDPWKYIMGYGWRTNLTARIKEHSEGYIVTDENGASYEYDLHLRPKKSSFSNHDAFKHTLTRINNKVFIWRKMHGTSYRFEYFKSDDRPRGKRNVYIPESCHDLLDQISNEDGDGNSGQSGHGSYGPRPATYRLARVNDRNGNAVVYEYGVGYFPTKMYYEQDPRLFIQFHYSGQNGALSKVQDPLGRVYQFEYSGRQLSKVKAPAVTYANQDNPTELQPNVANPTTSFTYQTLTGQSDGAGKIIICMDSITDPEGNVVNLNYQVLRDGQGNTNAHLKTITTPGAIDGQAHFTFTDTGNSRVSTIVDTKGKVWRYVFRASNQRITYQNVVPDADQDFEEFVLDNFTRTVSHNNRNYSMFADFTVGSFGQVNLTEVIDYWGVKFQYQYLGAHSKYGMVTKEIQDPGGLNITKEFGYGTNWQMSRIIDPRGPDENDKPAFTTTYDLDGAGNRLVERAPEGKITSFEYELGYQTKAVDADGRTTLSKRFYHSAGWDDVSVVLLNYNDARTYEDLGIDYTAYTPSNDDDFILTVKKFDLVGNLRFSIDGNGNVTENRYDGLNTLYLSKSPDVDVYGEEGQLPSITLFYRDLNRQVVGKQDSRGNWTTMKYDSMLRPIETRIEVSINGAEDIVTNTSYDNAGNKEYFTDARGTVFKFSYDPFNNLVEEVKDFGQGEDFLNLTSTYEYGVHSGNDLFGDSGFVPTKKVDPRGLVTLLEYDKAYRLKRTKRGPAGSEVLLSQIDYDVAGNVVKTTTYNDKISDINGNYVNASTHTATEDGDVSGNQETVTKYDKLNRPYITIVNLNDTPASETDSADIVTRTFYDKTGNVVKVVDPEGHSTQTEYDAAGRVVKQVVNLDYDEDTKTDEATFEDQNGNPFTISASAVDIVTSKTYDDNSNVLTETIHNDSVGAVGDQTVTKVFDALNRPVSVIDPAGYTTITEYDLNNNVRYVKNARGNETITEYDEANRAFRQTLPLVEDAEGVYDPINQSYPTVNPVVVTYFDTNSNVLQTVDARGLVTVNKYDALNRLEETRQVIGQNDDDEGVTETDDIVSENEYDGNNNLVKTTFKRIGLDLDTLQLVNVDLVTSTEYDSLDRPLITEDPEGFQSVVFCDLVGNKVKLFDKRANSLIVDGKEEAQDTPQLRYFTKVKFDLANRMVKNTLPEIPVAARTGNTVTVSNLQPYSEVRYLKNNWVKETVDLNGKITKTDYDGAGRKLKITTAINQITDYEYDKSSNVLVQTVYNDGLGGDQITTYEYDRRNLLLKEKLNEGDPDFGRTYEYTYDENGNKKTRKFPNGDLTTYNYDALDRLSSEIYANANDEKREYKYNLNGAVVLAKDNTGSTEYDYDILGRQVKEKKTDLSNTVTEILSVYDKANNRIRCYFPNDKKTLVSFYDKRNLLKIMKGYHGQVVNDAAHTGIVELTTYNYNANGQQIRLETPNGQISSKEYDAADRITLSETKTRINDTTTVTAYKAEYKRDAVGNQLETVETRYDLSGDKVRNLGFIYDDVYRLTHEIDDLSGQTLTTEYRFDLQGNRLSKTVTDSSDTELEKWNYTNDILNRTTRVEKEEAQSLVRVYEYDYDDNGNRKLKKEYDAQYTVLVDHTYHYDQENRLISVEDSAGDIFKASYDYRTRRVTKDEGSSSAQNNLKTTKYIYDGGVTCQETEDVNGTETLVKQYIRGNGMGGGIGSVLYMERKQDLSSSASAVQEFYDNLGQGSGSNGSGLIAEYYAYNAVGSVVANTDQEGFVIRENDFDAYGNQVREQDWTSNNFPIEFGGSSNDLLFSTKERDFSTGLDYFGFRYYDAVLGKFTTRDPSGYPDGPNNYLYVNNNPINSIDPLGLNEESKLAEIEKRRQEQIEKSNAKAKAVKDRVEPKIEKVKVENEKSNANQKKVTQVQTERINNQADPKVKNDKLKNVYVQDGELKGKPNSTSNSNVQNSGTNNTTGNKNPNSTVKKAVEGLNNADDIRAQKVAKTDLVTSITSMILGFYDLSKAENDIEQIQAASDAMKGTGFVATSLAAMNGSKVAQGANPVLMGLEAVRPSSLSPSQILTDIGNGDNSGGSIQNIITAIYMIGSTISHKADVIDQSYKERGLTDYEIKMEQYYNDPFLQ